MFELNSIKRKEDPPKKNDFKFAINTSTTETKETREEDLGPSSQNN